TDGPPRIATAPPASATIAAAIAGATSGTISRFRTGAMIASRPKTASTIGRAAARAASDTPGDSASQPGTRPPAPAHARRPQRSAAESAGERGHGGGDDGDVPAGDRDDVARTNRGEVRRQLPVDAVAQPDHDPGGETGLRFRDRSRERVAGAASHALEPGGRP